MTITAAPLSIEHRGSAVSASAWFHTSDPGEFAVDYPDGITGPPTVTAAGTRAWRNGLKHGQYLSCDGAETASRASFTLFIAVMTDTLRRSASIYTYSFQIGNLFENGAGFGLTNWGLCAYRLPTTNPLVDTGYFTFLYTPSPPTPSSSVAGFLAFGCSSTPELIRLAVTYDGTTLRRMINSRSLASSSNVTITGTCGSEYLVVQHTLEALAKRESVASNDDLDAWFADGTLPAAGLSLNLSGGHEVVESAPVFWDTTGTNDLKTVAIPPGFYPAAAAGDFTDTGFTSPLVEVPITIAADCAAGVHEITLRRRRVGIPDRTPPLPDAVLYDDGVIPVTVVAIPAVVHTGPVQIIQARMSDNPVAYVQITADREGTVAISCDRTVIDFPLTAIIGPSLEVTIEGAILKGGDCDVTAVMV